MRTAREKAAFSTTVYHDQPIVMTAREMGSFVPDEIAAARELESNLGLTRTVSTKLFYQQAKMLEAYEDDYRYRGKLPVGKPFYANMANEQLRGYFAWRTKARRGIITGASSFAYVYLCELINGIGTGGPQQGYHTMRRFFRSYRIVDHSIDWYANWLNDYVIYYDLDPQLIDTIAFREQDEALQVLLEPDGRTDEELFAAITVLAGHTPEKAEAWAGHSAEMTRATVQAYRAVEEHHAGLKRTLVERLFGVATRIPYRIFASAHFANPLRMRTHEYRISPCDVIRREGTQWTRERYLGNEHPNLLLANLLQSVDAELCMQCGIAEDVPQTVNTKYVLKIIKREVRAAVTAQREADARRVTIDFDKLRGIRQAAEITQDRLIVDEEDADEPVAPAQAPSRPVTPNDAARPSAPAPAAAPDAAARHEAASPSPAATPSQPAQNGPQALTPEEQAFLLLLLETRPVRPFEQQHHVMASVIADRINDKLLDEFDDIVIDCSSDEPQLIEDYADDVRGLLEAR